MIYSDTTALEKIQNMDARINIIQGGARAGKTTALLINICDLSFAVQNKVISIVTDTFPNLKRGAMRDWGKILRDMGRTGYFTENKTDHIWTNKVTGTMVEFFSCEADDALGADRDYLFINEAWRIPYKTFDQLMLRTKVMAWLDFNPINEFWVHTEVMRNRTDWKFEKLTYLDNEAIPEGVLSDLLQHKGDGTSNWWRVYGLGEIGSLEGNVYEGWIAEDEIPSGVHLLRYGVDFGFSNDPTAVIAVYEDDNGEIWLKQELCQTKLLTPQLIEKLKEIIKQDGDALFVCDNARPEIIAELQANGIRAIGCDKTPGEKMNGKRYNIELVQRRKVHYLRSDKELEREYLTYAWRKKKTGEILDEPQDGNDHCMDAIAYAIRDLERKSIEWGGVIG